MPTERLKDTTLIIAGHGSSKSPNMARPARKHAERIQEMDLFGDVLTAFWKEDVNLNEVMDHVKTSEVVVVPNLACSGHINKVVIPREMGLTGDETHSDGRTVYMCPPVGEHDGLPALIAGRLKEVMQERSLNSKETTVFLAAHGNPNPERPASHDNTVMMATRIYQHVPMHAILPAFIEEKPYLHGWKDRTNSPNVIVVPFMIAAGTHGAKDIPQFMGVEPTDQQFEDMLEHAIPAGPFVVGDQKVWLMRAFGSHEKISDFIVDIAFKRLGLGSYL
jgi:sirohydrochlorin cobaltochelatase